MSLGSYSKDPSDVLDYVVNWATWLDSDTIATVTWTVPAGITNVSTSNTTTTATIWLSGGTENTTYTIACKITTAATRTAERSFDITVDSL